MHIKCLIKCATRIRPAKYAWIYLGVAWRDTTRAPATLAAGDMGGHIILATTPLAGAVLPLRMPRRRPRDNWLLD